MSKTEVSDLQDALKVIRVSMKQTETAVHDQILSIEVLRSHGLTFQEINRGRQLLMRRNYAEVRAFKHKPQNRATFPTGGLTLAELGEVIAAEIKRAQEALAKVEQDTTQTKDEEGDSSVSRPSRSRYSRKQTTGILATTKPVGRPAKRKYRRRLKPTLPNVKQEHLSEEEQEEEDEGEEDLPVRKYGVRRCTHISITGDVCAKKTVPKSPYCVIHGKKMVRTSKFPPRSSTSASQLDPETQCLTVNYRGLPCTQPKASEFGCYYHARRHRDHQKLEQLRLQQAAKRKRESDQQPPFDQISTSSINNGHNNSRRKDNMASSSSSSNAIQSGSSNSSGSSSSSCAMVIDGIPFLQSNESTIKSGRHDEDHEVCLRTLGALVRHEFAWAFNNPVFTSADGAVQTSVEGLFAIRDRLLSWQLTTVDDFVQVVFKCFDTCVSLGVTNNENNDLYQMATVLKAAFRKLLFNNDLAKCNVCHSRISRPRNRLIMCSNHLCSMCYHQECHVPPMVRSSNDSDLWTCASCTPMTSSTPVISQLMNQLQVLRADFQRFSEVPVPLTNTSDPVTHILASDVIATKSHVDTMSSESASTSRVPLTNDQNNSNSVSVRTVQSWTTHDVAVFLQSIGLGNLSSAFVNHGITGRWLLELTDRHLEHDFGIKILGTRFYLLSAIATLRSSTATTHQQ